MDMGTHESGKPIKAEHHKAVMQDDASAMGTNHHGKGKQKGAKAGKSNNKKGVTAKMENSGTGCEE